jgi:hypothetical protein
MRWAKCQPVRRAGPRRHPAGRHHPNLRVGRGSATQHRRLAAADAGGRRAGPGRRQCSRLPHPGRHHHLVRLSESGGHGRWAAGPVADCCQAAGAVGAAAAAGRRAHQRAHRQLRGVGGDGLQSPPGTRSFGESTAGVPTGSLHRLTDGAELHLTEAVGVDRTGRSYHTGSSPISPSRPTGLTMDPGRLRGYLAGDTWHSHRRGRSPVDATHRRRSIGQVRLDPT